MTLFCSMCVSEPFCCATAPTVGPWKPFIVYGTCIYCWRNLGDEKLLRACARFWWWIGLRRLWVACCWGWGMNMLAGWLASICGLLLITSRPGMD